MKQNNSSGKYSCIIILLLLILLAIAVIIFFMWRSGIFSQVINSASSQESELLTIPESDSFAQDNQIMDSGYQEIAFLPFDFQFSVPSDWVVETTETGGESASQKCLAYHISSPGEFARLEVFPLCGPYGGVPETCPQSTEIIGSISDDSLGRYSAVDGDQVLQKITYTNVADNYCVGMVLNSTIALRVTADYNGPASEWSWYLNELDKIVLSLAK